MSRQDRATLAAQAATRAGFYLHGAAVAKDPAEERRLYTRAFHCWSVAARQMAEMERLTPNCAREGYDEAAKIQDFVEARQG